MTQYTITATGKKLDMEGLKTSQKKATLIKNVRARTSTKLELKNIIVNEPAKLKAVVPSLSPVTVTEKVDEKQTTKLKKSKGE